MTRRRVNAFVEALLGNRRPQAFSADADDREAMRTAIELRAAHEGDATPSPQFVAELHQELSRQLDGAPSDGIARISATPVEMPRISRRRWLLEGAVAASAAGVAVVVDRTAFASRPAVNPSAQGQLTPDTGTWHTVAERADLLTGAVTRFSTPGAIGFVATENGVLEAVSGVCSHQGCLLKFNEAARRLDCPCHRAAFSLTGKVLFSQLPTPPPPLPRLAVRDIDGHVQVNVPRLV
jgi:nitrite reductase/ring-hydroxylating ferredoxin subunit